MSFSSPTEDSFLVLLKKLQGRGGYTEDDDSVRVDELAAWANLAADASAHILSAANQAWAGTADALLFEIEIARGLRNSASRTQDQQRARINAIRQGDGRKSPIETALKNAGVIATIFVVLRDHISEPVVPPTLPLREELPEESIYQVALLVADADYDNPETHATAIDVLEKLLPAHSRSHMGSQAIDDVLASSIGIRWGSNDRLDRSVLFPTAIASVILATTGDPNSALLPSRQLPSGSRRLRLRHPSRLKPYGPLSKLRSYDFNAIQDNLLFGPPNQNVQSRSGLLSSAGVGGEWMFVCMQTAFGNKIVDSQRSWSDRYITFIGRISTLNILPGGFHGTDINHIAPPVAAFGYTGTGETNGVGPNNGIVVDGSAHFYANFVGGTHELMLHDTVPGTRYIVGILIATPKLGNYLANTAFPSLNPPYADPANPRRLTSFVKEQAAPAVAWFNFVRDHSHFRLAQNSLVPGEDGSFPIGGVHRTGVAVNFQVPTSHGAFRTVVLDSTVDWRDRALLLSYRLNDGLNASAKVTIPGGQNDAASIDSSILFGYTGPGRIPQLAYADADFTIRIAQATVVTLAHIIVFADADTGELLLEIDSVNGVSTDAWLTLMLDVHGTEQMNAIGLLPRVTPPAIPTTGDGGQILAFDLDALQDGAMCTQMRSGDPMVPNRYGGSTAFATPEDMKFPASSSSWPMGPIGARPSTEQRSDPSLSEAALDPQHGGIPEADFTKLGNARIPLVRRVGPQLPSVRVNLFPQDLDIQRVPDLSGRPDYVQRQNVAGGVRIYFQILVPANVITTIDDSVDWRDRFINCVASTLTATNQFPGGAADSTIWQAPITFACGYTGEGVKHLIACGTTAVLFADEYQPALSPLPKRGRLCIYSPLAITRVVGMIWASFQFGCAQKAEHRINFVG
jgi:hypothetical protein